MIQRTVQEKWPNQFGVADMILCGSWILKQEAVILNNHMWAMQWKMLEYICLAKGVALLGDVTILGEVHHFGWGL